MTSPKNTIFVALTDCLSAHLATKPLLASRSLVTSANNSFIVFNYEEEEAGLLFEKIRASERRGSTQYFFVVLNSRGSSIALIQKLIVPYKSSWEKALLSILLVEGSVARSIGSGEQVSPIAAGIDSLHTSDCVFIHFRATDVSLFTEWLSNTIANDMVQGRRALSRSLLMIFRDRVHFDAGTKEKFEAAKKEKLTMDGYEQVDTVPVQPQFRANAWMAQMTGPCGAYDVWSTASCPCKETNNEHSQWSGAPCSARLSHSEVDKIVQLFILEPARRAMEAAIHKHKPAPVNFMTHIANLWSAGGASRDIVYHVFNQMDPLPWTHVFRYCVYRGHSQSCCRFLRNAVAQLKRYFDSTGHPIAKKVDEATVTLSQTEFEDMGRQMEDLRAENAELTETLAAVHARFSQALALAKAQLAEADAKHAQVLQWLQESEERERQLGVQLKQAQAILQEPFVMPHVDNDWVKVFGVQDAHHFVELPIAEQANLMNQHHHLLQYPQEVRVVRNDDLLPHAVDPPNLGMEDLDMHQDVGNVLAGALLEDRNRADLNPAFNDAFLGGAARINAEPMALYNARNAEDPPDLEFGLDHPLLRGDDQDEPHDDHDESGNWQDAP